MCLLLLGVGGGIQAHEGCARGSTELERQIRVSIKEGFILGGAV